jgi:hypothetical protein
LALLQLTPSSPQLNYNARNETFQVKFEKGASWACFGFKSEKETIELDGKVGPYEPHKCYGFSEGLTSINENWEFIDKNDGFWDVSVVVQYANPDGSFTDVTSNTLQVKH